MAEKLEVVDSESDVLQQIVVRLEDWSKKKQRDWVIESDRGACFKIRVKATMIYVSDLQFLIDNKAVFVSTITNSLDRNMLKF
jgi:hypothetical protein